MIDNEDNKVVADALQKKIAELENKIKYDQLTGLLSRAAFLEFFIKNASKGDVLIFIDLDDFKSVNDTYGHSIGDGLLTKIGHVLLKIVDKIGEASRLAGDEFVVYIKQTDTSNLESLVNCILRKIEATEIQYGNNLISRSASLGYVKILPNMSPDDAIIAADHAVRIAKRNGKGAAIPFEDRIRNLQPALPSREELKRALKRKEIGYFLQPISYLIDGKVWGYEALLRWSKKNGEIIGPSYFLTNLLKSYDINNSPPLDEARRVSRWVTQDSNKNICLNISSAFLAMIHEKGVDWLDQIIGDLPRDKVVLEIVESVIDNNDILLPEIVSRLQEHGVRVALDDFGSGQSTLMRLQSINVDFVKIDRSFLVAASKSKRDFNILKSMVDLAHSSGAQAVIEGIESEYQLSVAKSSGASLGQGFYLGRPASLEHWQNHESNK